VIPTIYELPRHLREFVVNRSIFITSPSHDAWLCKTKKFHLKDKIQCVATKKSHHHTHLQIEKDVKRKKSYWLLIFGEEVILGNHIFETDATAISTKIVGIESEAGDNELKKTLDGIVIYWRVGEKFWGRQFESNKKEVDATSLFD
jgi:hypothetical protein